MPEKPSISDIKRRDFLKIGTVTTAGAALAGLTPLYENIDRDQVVNAHFKTDLCDLLGIKYPILQAGMSGVAGPELVAAVSNAGGLGILTGTLVPPDELRQRIRRVKSLTQNPFGLNFLLHEDLVSPRDTASIPGTAVTKVHLLLNQFRRKIGIPERTDHPPTVPDLLQTTFEIMLEERVPVWSIGLGCPGKDMVDQCRARGIRIIAMVATVEDAKVVEAAGVDAIIAQGGEAGGHRSTWVKKESPERAGIGTMSLVPQVVQNVSKPVIAAGGITSGAGLIASIALGAQGILVGTRFIATQESQAPDFHKKALLQSSSDNTTVTDVFTGMYARVLRNRFTEDYAAAGVPVLPPFSQFLAARDIIDMAAQRNESEYFTLYCGQGIGTFHDMPGAGEIVQRIVDEANDALDSLPGKILRR